MAPTVIFRFICVQGGVFIRDVLFEREQQLCCPHHSGRRENRTFLSRTAHHTGAQALCVRPYVQGVDRQIDAEGDHGFGLFRRNSKARLNSYYPRPAPVGDEIQG